MTVLVTGGGGFLGLYLTEQLVARGETVRVFCRGQYAALDSLGVEIIRGDIRDQAAITAACAGVDTVYHTAAVPGVWGPWNHYHSINTIGTANIIRACQQQGVSKLVYTSSPSVVYDGAEHHQVDESQPYPASYLCHYPHTKAIAERTVLAANNVQGVATVSLRPHLIWGPRDNNLIPRLIQRAKAGKLRRVGDGQNQISMSYVENAAAAHLQAADVLSLDSPVAGQAYFVNEVESVKLWPWIDEILALADLPPLEKSISASAAWRVGAILEGVYGLLRRTSEPSMTRFVAAQLSGSHTYSVAKAQRDFGLKSIVTVEEGMHKLGQELQQRFTTAAV